jgi:beta-phosphoglucomutase-like phosphatase (HAD superfamily)
MDGTLVDSTAGVEGAWETFAETYPGIDVQDILSSTVSYCLSCNFSDTSDEPRRSWSAHH